MTVKKNPLRDGWTIIVKRECATCVMVVPVIARLIKDLPNVMVYTQDDPAFPEGISAVSDLDLCASWHADIDTVPSLIFRANGVETKRTIGWLRKDWRELTGIADLGSELPEFRPGCGSMSVDPDIVDKLRVLYGGEILHARQIEIASAEDEFEAMFSRGYTDGLPVVPPTPERVMRMLSGTTRDPQEVVVLAPPDLVELTIEKIAINAVMAGCLPEYLPWVIAAVEAVCTDEYNMHGVLATTMPVGPVIICNGPGTRAIGMNSGVNVLGQGNRANLTIGRAVQLIIRNVGGGRPGEVDRAAHGHPGKLSFCFAEDEIGSPFTSLAVARGFDASQNTVTVFTGEGPRCVVDQLAREPDQLAQTFAACLRTVHHPKLPFAFDAVLVLGPEHARVFAQANWSRERVLQEIESRLQLPGSEIVRGAGGMAEGVQEAFKDATLPKFRPGGLLLVHAGGPAGSPVSASVGGDAIASGGDPVSKLVV